MLSILELKNRLPKDFIDELYTIKSTVITYKVY